jgi:hypothetical protein
VISIARFPITPDDSSEFASAAVSQRCHDEVQNRVFAPGIGKNVPKRDRIENHIPRV